ncbi:MAG TPA: phosphate acyltransferase PlsX [Oscillospiraceae bacterium]|nr:phosphate acyltransferase PlsX [Oscillospiraceae bacterium]
MKIIVDAFGGDNAPLEVIKGSAMAVENLGVEILLTGDESVIKKTAEENKISLHNISIIDTKTVIDIHDEPTMVIKEKADCSMAVGLKELAAGNGDAFVSAGSTGALVVGATFIVKRLKGIKRAALAPILPSEKGNFMLMDAGANVDCRPEMLVQFAIMGSCYMEKILGIKEPRVGLVNVGAEDTKGREIELTAYKLLQDAPVNFAGNAEARDIPGGNFDVVVSDGFTGNVVLKLIEGMGSFFSHTLKDILLNGIISKIAALLVMKKLKGFRKKMDYTEQGGAALMGISKPVIKAHGSSNAKAFYNAIRQAKNFSEKKVIDEISKSLDILKERTQISEN